MGRAKGLALAWLLTGAVAAWPAAASAALVENGADAVPGSSTAVVTAEFEQAETSWQVEYGTTTSYDRTTQIEARFAGEPAGPVSVRLTGLEPGTEYHYRFVAGLADPPGVQTADRTFTTLPDAPAADLAAAIGADPGLVTGGAWEERPPITEAVPSALLGAPLAGFPLDGPGAALLTTGTADLAGVPDQAENASTGLSGGPAPGRGDTALDASVLRVDVEVPAGRSCLSLDFRFLSEEFPEYVGGIFNDAFIAELDATTWTTAGSDIASPGNFAFGPQQRPVSVNGLGDTAVSEEQAQGTTYDAATTVLRASTPVTPGSHSLYLSLFDQGDAQFDSAVLLDRLTTSADSGTACAQGAVDAAKPRPPGGGLLVVPPLSGGVSPVTEASAPPPPAPQPQLRRQVVGTASGTVFVTLPGGRRIRLGSGEAIPLGATVDTRAGRVRLSAADGNGGTMDGWFWGGVFRVTQSGGAPVRTELRLTEALGACARPGGARSSAKRKKRFLWGDGKGRFRTTGKNAAATVRGTRWLLQDSCAGTLVRVTRGVVDVRDLVRKRTVPVRAGGRYLARPRR
jgi:hypothetical protein